MAEQTKTFRMLDRHFYTRNSLYQFYRLEQSRADMGLEGGVAVSEESVEPVLRLIDCLPRTIGVISRTNAPSVRPLANRSQITSHPVMLISANLRPRSRTNSTTNRRSSPRTKTPRLSRKPPSPPANAAVTTLRCSNSHPALASRHRGSGCSWYHAARRNKPPTG